MRYSNIFSRLFHASRYSLEGLYYALKHEQAFQYEFIVLIIIILAGKSLLLAGAWLIVMCLELINSAVEKAFDLIDKNFRHEIKAGKDMLSCAIFLAVCFNIILWVYVIIMQ